MSECFFCSDTADGQVTRWTGSDVYSRFACLECADERGFTLSLMSGMKQEG